MSIKIEEVLSECNTAEFIKFLEKGFTFHLGMSDDDRKSLVEYVNKLEDFYDQQRGSICEMIHTITYKGLNFSSSRDVLDFIKSSRSAIDKHDMGVYAKMYHQFCDDEFRKASGKERIDLK